MVGEPLSPLNYIRRNLVKRQHPALVGLGVVAIGVVVRMYIRGLGKSLANHMPNNSHVGGVIPVGVRSKWD